MFDCCLLVSMITSSLLPLISWFVGAGVCAGVVVLFIFFLAGNKVITIFYIHF